MKKYLFLFLAILSILETQATFEKIGNVIIQTNVNNNLHYENKRCLYF